MKKPLISICIPSYNHERFVREAIESVLNQTYSNFEMVIVDNCSTDNALNIIKSYDDPRIRLYENDSNIGGDKSTNQAVKLAKGELIAILHTDDKYDKHFLEEIVKAYNEYPDHKVFVTAIYNIDHLLGLLVPNYPYNTEGIISRKEIMTRLAYENNIGNGMNVVVHKDVIGDNDYYSPKYRLASDQDLFMRLGENYNFVYINKLLTYYRRHDSNLTNKVFLDMLKEGHEICNKHLKNSKFISDELHKELFRVQCKSMINKALYIGFKYSSRELTQDLLKYFRSKYSDLKYDYNWYLVYGLSYLINGLTSKFLTLTLFKLGRYYRAYTNRNVDKVVLLTSEQT